MARLVLLVLSLALAPGGARATTASVSPAGHLLVDGAPFFPVGIVHVSWIGDRQGKKAVPDLHAIAVSDADLFVVGEAGTILHGR